MQLQQMKSMPLQQYIPYFRQSIAQFIGLSTKQDHQDKVQTVSENIINLAKYDMFLEVAFYVLTQYAKTNSSFQNVLISNLIKDKFKYEFQEIPSQNHLKYYYNELIGIFNIQKVKSIKMQTSRAFFNNIELSLTYIFLSVIAHKQESIENYLSPIIPQNESLADSKQANHYIKVLGFISSEIQDDKFVTDQKSRDTARQYLVNNQQLILVMLNNGCPQLWNNIHIQMESIIQAFTCWVTLNYNEMIYKCLPQHFLTDKVFQLLKDDETLQSGVQSIKYLVNSAKSYFENQQFFDLFLHKIRNCLAKQTQKLILRKQFVIAESYVEAIIIISKKLTNKYIYQIKQYILFVKTIAELSLYKSIDLTNSIVNFWEDFMDQTYVYIEENSYIHVEVFQLFAIFLYELIISKCQFTKSDLQKLQHDEKSDSRRYKDMATIRGDVEDLLISISKILGIKQYVSLVGSKISQEINKQEKKWSRIQAYYSSLLIKPIQNYQKGSFEDNFDRIAQINGYYYTLVEKENLPINFDDRYRIPTALKRTFLRFLKAIMKIKSLDQIIIRQAILYAQVNFSNILLNVQAQKTFARICEVKSHVFEDNIGDIIGLLDRYPLKSNIVSGVFHLICQKSQSIQQYLYQTFERIFKTVKKTFTSQKQHSQLIMCLISSARVLLESKNVQNHLEICKDIYKLLWPFIQQILVNPQNVEDDEDIGIQRIAKLLKFIIRCLNLEFQQFLTPLFKSIEKGYSKYPVCSYLYVFQVVVPIFSNNVDRQAQLLEFYRLLCKQTSNYFISLDLERHIMLLQDFCGMNKKFFMCNAALISKSQMFEGVLELCFELIINSSSLKVSRACYSYFEAIFMVYWRKQFIQEYNQESKEKSAPLFTIQNQDAAFYNQFKYTLLPKIPDLLNQAFYHLSTCPNEATKEYILECILAETKAFNIQNLEIWAKVLNNFRSQIMLANQKQQFFNSLSHLNDENTTKISKAIQVIKRFLVLISKRYTYAYKRANIKLYPSCNKQ